MRGVSQGVRAWVYSLSMLGGAGCGLVPDDLWQLYPTGHHPPGPSEPPAPAPVDARLDQSCLEQQLTPFVDAIGAGWPATYRPTGTVLVSAAGRALYSRNLGASDWEQGTPNGADTSFRVGSITKGFTAAAILQLAEAGRVRLDGTIGEYLQEYPAVGAGITLHQLLSHTAGLFNYTRDPELRTDLPLSPIELLARFWSRPLEFEPGTQFSYSNSGYAVLGAIIERVTGQTYADYMRDAIFVPAGLARTTVGDAEGLPDRALGYNSDLRGGLEPVPPIDMSIPYAAGAIRSTALDLARWHRALSTDVLLDERSRELLETPVLSGYAYGWSVAEQAGLKVVRHNGGIDGFLSDLVRVPEVDLAVVVLLNSLTVDPGRIADAALSCALGEDIAPEPPPPLVELDAGQRERLVGTYALTPESRQLLASVGFAEAAIAPYASMVVSEAASELLLAPVGQEPGVLLPTSAVDFAYPWWLTTLSFSPAEGGALPATTLTMDLGGGLEVSFER